MRVINIIKKKRIEKGWTTEQLSEKLYVSRKTIYNWEQYDTEPNINQIVKLSEVLKIGITTIIKDYAKNK